MVTGHNEENSQARKTPPEAEWASGHRHRNNAGYDISDGDRIEDFPWRPKADNCIRTQAERGRSCGPFREPKETFTVCLSALRNSSAFRNQPPRGIRLPRYPGVMNVTVMYCPIQKTGSTTWKGILRSIGQNMSKAHIRGIEVNVPFGKHDVSFTFVREPYSRLLSAYVDKLLSPNTLFSKITGRYVIAKFRQNASKKSIDCGYDVTFPEFVRYFIHAQTSGQKRNGHFTPTHDHCGMCQHPYKYIGHLETLKDDMPFILKAMQSPVAYNKSFDNVTIKNGAAMILQRMRNGIKQCMDLDEACRRLWKTMANWQRQYKEGG